MKKIITAILLSVMLLACGCRAAIEIPEVANVDMKPFKLIMEKVQKNIDKGTFEGLSEKSTFDEVAAADLEFSRTGSTFTVDFLGFPANVTYNYDLDNGKLLFRIRPDDSTDYEKIISEVLNKLGGTLGSHTEKQIDDGWNNYIWEDSTYQVVLEYYESDALVCISLTYQDKDISPSKILGIFYKLFGVEYTASYENEMQVVLINKGGPPILNYIIYLEDDISINLRFVRNKELNNALNLADYSLTTDIGNVDSALDYTEACLSALKQVFGEPETCDYKSNNDKFAETAEEVKQLGWDGFMFSAFWENGSTHLNIFYNDNTAELTLGFDRRSF